GGLCSRRERADEQADREAVGDDGEDDQGAPEPRDGEAGGELAGGAGASGPSPRPLRTHSVSGTFTPAGPGFSSTCDRRVVNPFPSHFSALFEDRPWPKVQWSVFALSARLTSNGRQSLLRSNSMLDGARPRTGKEKWESATSDTERSDHLHSSDRLGTSVRLGAG